MSTSSVLIFMADFAGGGAERVMVNLANQLSRESVDVHMMVARPEGPYRSLLSEKVRLRPLGRRLCIGAGELARYSCEIRPIATVVSGIHACAIACVSRRFRKMEGRLILTVHGSIGRGIRGMFRGKQSIDPLLARMTFGWSDHVVAVSQGLAKEVQRTAKLDGDKVSTIYNPLAGEELIAQADKGATYPWSRNPDVALFVAVGRLVWEKGFDVLLRAFAIARKRKLMRLVVLGDGPERRRLEDLAERLRITEDVWFAGFVANPHPLVAGATALVVSSRYEGFGNVIVEAMSVGTRVIAADCPYGPREILMDGDVGTLIPPEDVHALAAALVECPLTNSVRDKLLSRAAEFSIERNVAAYRRLMGV